MHSLRRIAPEQAPLLPKHTQGSPNSKQLHPRKRGTGALAIAFTILLMLHMAANFLTSLDESPVYPPAGVAWEDLELGLDGDASASLTALYPPSEPLAGPTRIPRIIHHLYNSTDAGLEASELSYLRWRRVNPGWELRFYDEAESQDIVGRWFPKYLSIYRSLRTEGEKRDLFRYLAVLKHGGVFADVSIATPSMSLKSLDEVVRSDDTMVTSWDVEFPSGQAAINSCYIRARQLHHKLFAAAPGHPVLLETVQRIAATIETRFSLHPLIDALERTGPGVFTDAVLKHAQKHPPALRDSDHYWSIRLLPQKAFGEMVVQQQGCEQPWDNDPRGENTRVDGIEIQQQQHLSSDGDILDPLSLQQKSNRNAVQHQISIGNGVTSSLALGRGGLPVELTQQQQQKQIQMQQPGVGRTRRLARWWWSLLWPSHRGNRSGNNGNGDGRNGDEAWRHADRPDVAVATHLERLAATHEEQQLFPVSADFEPPFDVMTHLISHGERQSGWDVSQIVSTFGAWQPSVQPTRKPSLVQAVVGSLGRLPTSSALDSSLAIDYSNSSSGVLVDVGAGYGIISLAAAARGHRVHSFELGPGSLRALEASIERNGFGSLVQVHKVPLGSIEQRGSTCLELQAGATTTTTTVAVAAGSGTQVSDGSLVEVDGPKNIDTASPLPPNVEIARGYSDPAAHAVAGHACARSALRIPGAEAIPAGEKVGALRISANGWEGFVLDGFLPLIRRQLPPVIAIEWNPTSMKAVGYASPLDMLSLLSSLGYDDISHSGFICDERWYAVTYGVRRRGGQRPEDQPGLRQPTWCRLLPEDHNLLLEKANSKYPETLLFINRKSGKATTSAAGAPDGNDAASQNTKKTSGGSTSSSGVAAAAETVFDNDEGIVLFGAPRQESG